MAFCPNCGAQVEGRFCAKCGTAVAAPAGPGAPPQPAPQAPAAGAGLQENVACALCYVLGLITGILFLALAPYNQNKTIRFHAFQAIFFHVAWIVLWIVLMIVGFIMPSFVWFLMWIIRLGFWLIGFLLWLFLMYKAYNNERFMLPVIGALAEKQA